MNVIKGQDELRRAYQDDRVAREYVDRRFDTPLGALLHARQVGVLRSLVERQGVRRAIEIAPGPARVTVDVAPLLDRVILIDASVQMLREARRRLESRRVATPVHFVQSDAFRLPVVTNVDLVYSFRLIRHFELDDRRRLYAEVAARVRPGGWLVFDAVNRLVSEPLRRNAKPGEYEHYDALLQPDEIQEEVRDAGFEVVSLAGVQHRYSWLMASQVYVAPRSRRLARLGMEVADRLGGEPLEWVVVCRRR